MEAKAESRADPEELAEVRMAVAMDQVVAAPVVMVVAALGVMALVAVVAEVVTMEVAVMEVAEAAEEMAVGSSHMYADRVV